MIAVAAYMLSSHSCSSSNRHSTPTAKLTVCTVGQMIVFIMCLSCDWYVYFSPRPFWWLFSRWVWVRAVSENWKIYFVTVWKSRLFCSLPVLNPRIGHKIDVLSLFMSVLCRSDWLFCGESCPRVDVVHSGLFQAVHGFLTCVHLALFLTLSLSPGNSLISSWCDHSMLALLFWQCPTVPSLPQLC